MMSELGELVDIKGMSRGVLACGIMGLIVNCSFSWSTCTDDQSRFGICLIKPGLLQAQTIRHVKLI